ncbi:hypothetical protein NKG94_43895 [Micromonospora sp. M12]
MSMDAAGFSGFTLETSGGMLTLFLVLAVAFFLGGRMWRALPRGAADHNPRPPSADTARIAACTGSGRRRT